MTYPTCDAAEPYRAPQGAKRTADGKIIVDRSIRENKDCLYSHAVVDCSKGAVIKNPAWDKYSIIQIMDENQYSFAHLYPGESIKITPDMLTSGSYVWLNIRTQVSPEDGDGYYDAHKHQDAYVIEAASATPYKPKGFDEGSLTATRNALLKEASKVSSWMAFGKKDVVDPEQFVIAAAGGWAGLRRSTPSTGRRSSPRARPPSWPPSKLTLPKAPLDYEHGGFYSATNYGPDAFIATEDYARATAPRSRTKTAARRSTSTPRVSRTTSRPCAAGR
jgi:hypothetical protein